MKIFIDSADIAEIKKYRAWGVCDGVTTNPTIFLKAGVQGGAKGMTRRSFEIAKLITPLSYSVEVTSDDPAQVLKQARAYARLAKNISVKVTITDRHGNSLLPAIRALIAEGVSVNVTAITTFNQALLAAKVIAAGHAVKAPRTPSFISIFAGRISEEQGIERAFEVVSDVRQWLDFYEFKNVEIIVGSVRSPENVEYWSRAGAHILTIPPDVIGKLLRGARTKETVAQFLEDSKKSLEELN